MENILSCLWRHNMLKGCSLSLSDGTPVDIILPGKDSNNNLIFDNALIRIEDSITKLRVAISPASPEGCDLYISSTPENIDGNCSLLIIPFADEIEKLRKELYGKSCELPCNFIFKSLSEVFVSDLISSLAIERLIEKSERIKKWLDVYNGDWEEVCYVSIARSLGFGINSNGFEALAKALPLKFLQKHADSLFQLEAMLFGVAGFLNNERLMSIPYYRRLSNEFSFLRNKFSLPTNDIGMWHFSGTRPSNFPHQRIALLAAIIHTSLPIFAKFIEAKKEESLRKVFDVYPSEFWENHYTFSSETPPLRKTLGRTAVDLLMINSIAPLLYAYSEYINNQMYADKAIEIIEECKAENNAIVRKFGSAGLECKSALASQAFLALNNNYCNPRNCLRCKIGYKLFRDKIKECCG